MQVVMDTCTVIRVMEEPATAARMRRSLRGKSYRIVLCRQALVEIRRVRRWSEHTVLARLRGIFGEKRVKFGADPENLDARAASLRKRYMLAHRGDDRILAMCRILGLGLLTHDRGMLKAAEMVGVLAFHAKYAGAL